MTAEIAILSKAGVALAADSALTLEIENSRGRERKIYNSSNKMFALSKFHPVGIMVFGNATLMNFPWEVIIKNYRNKLWDTQFDKIENYVEDFLEFCVNSISEEDQELYFRRNISLYYLMVCNEIKDSVKKSIQDKASIPLQEIKEIVTQIIQNRLNYLNKLSKLSTFPDNFENDVLKNRENVILEQIKKRFENLPLSKKNLDSLKQIAGLLFVKDIFPVNTSGVVIAGYGKKQNFPSIIELTIDGIVDKKIKYKISNKFEIPFDGEAAIFPFAQNEMVFTFMEGINPSYQKLINGAITKIINEYPKILLENIPTCSENEKKDILKKLVNVGNNVEKDILMSFKEYRSKQFASPVLDAVGALPKDEMATMAETLVNLTSFKRKMSLDAETVGGPIDVAVISKGDGFVWIKRKHYFNPDLNHHFFKNYYNKPD